MLKGGGADEKPKPTSAIEYVYIRKTNVNKKELIHAYEVGGGRSLDKMI